MRNADWGEMTLVMMSLPLARVFQCLHLSLFPLSTDWEKSGSSVNREPQGNLRWKSNSRDAVASSPSFFHLVARVPRRACSVDSWSIVGQLVHGPSGFSLPLGGTKATIYQIKAYHV